MAHAHQTDVQTAKRSWRSSFEGCVALITGGTSGIGYQIANGFLHAKAHVVIVGTDNERGKRAECRLAETAIARTGSEVLFLHGDVTSRAEMDAVMAEVKRRYGRLDVVVCSAGVGRKATLLETPEEDLSHLLRVNVQGVITSIQAAADLLTESAGSAILLSSDAGIAGERGAGAYSVTKAAVNMAGKMLALDLANRGVRVNVVAPGDIVPGMKSMVQIGEDERPADDYLSWPFPPIGRYGQAEEVADTVLFLASDAASFITGSILLIDGGMRAGMSWSPSSPVQTHIVG